MNLLVVYDLDASRSRRLVLYDDAREAVKARFAAERDEPGRLEIIVLGGESVEGMRRTHPKYFAGGREPVRSDVVVVGLDEVMPDEPATDAPATELCCGEKPAGVAGKPEVPACQLCPKSSTYWQREPAAAARLAVHGDGRLGGGVSS